MNKQQLDALATQVLDGAFEVHRELGPGLLENAYEMALCRELHVRGIPFERQKPMPVIYKGAKLDCGYRIDVFVDEHIVLELKSCEDIQSIHEAVLLNYLKLSSVHLGYLINFNVPLLKQGIKRLVNGALPVGEVELS